jgi:hypothetical protein
MDYNPDSRSPEPTSTSTIPLQVLALVNEVPVSGEAYFELAECPQPSRRPHWLGPRARKAFEEAGLVEPTPRDVIGTEERIRRFNHGLGIERGHSALANLSDYGFEGLSGGDLWTLDLSTVVSTNVYKVLKLPQRGTL